jgi:dTDP-4-amino-4,6-dideoxygalactose transaminase
MKTKFKPENKSHFYAASCARWKVSNEPEKLVKDMKKDGYSFSLYYVPVPIETDYQIEFYAPCIENTQLLGNYDV